jgi:ferrous iron transport protein A
VEKNKHNMLSLKTGDRARVIGYSQGDLRYRKRLLSMGLTRGTEFVLEKVAPMGDPMEIKLRGFYLSLRRQEADFLQIEKVDP